MTTDTTTPSAARHERKESHVWRDSDGWYWRVRRDLSGSFVAEYSQSKNFAQFAVASGCDECAAEIARLAGLVPPEER